MRIDTVTQQTQTCQHTQAQTTRPRRNGSHWQRHAGCSQKSRVRITSFENRAWTGQPLIIIYVLWSRRVASHVRWTLFRRFERFIGQVRGRAMIDKHRTHLHVNSVSDAFSYPPIRWWFITKYSNHLAYIDYSHWAHSLASWLPITSVSLVWTCVRVYVDSDKAPRSADWFGHARWVLWAGRASVHNHSETDTCYHHIVVSYSLVVDIRRSVLMGVSVLNTYQWRTHT